jgi:hypothetical protein
MICRAVAGVAWMALVGAFTVVEAQAADDVRCYVLHIDEPGAVYMLGRDIQGDTLVLTTEPLEGRYARREGTRAYIGMEDWRQKEPLRPASWAWTEQGVDSLRIGFVLPLAGIVWAARISDAGLDGTVTYVSDVVDEPRRTSPFRARRVPCTPHPTPPAAARSKSRSNMPSGEAPFIVVKPQFGVHPLLVALASSPSDSPAVSRPAVSRPQ